MDDREPTPGDAAEALVRAKYAEVARRASGHFPYPVGRASAERLGYPPAAIEAVPPEVVERFVGVGNPFRAAGPLEGARVLDVGCGCGFDAFVAAGLVGPSGRVVGVDATPEMLEVARRALATSPVAGLEFVRGSVLDLPFEDATFDVVLSNGVLNLVSDKETAVRELARVLRPGGTLAVADLLLVDDLPPEVRADPAAWAT